MPNRTRGDAATRIWYARPGCMIEATESYLLAVRSQLQQWLAEVDAEIARRALARGVSDDQP